MVLHMTVFAFVLATTVMNTVAQRSPYAGSDPGVLPIYLSDGSSNRFGGSQAAATQPPKIHNGTLETEDVYNRVQQWPDDRKPFWYLNSAAIHAQRQQQQQQQQRIQAAQDQNRKSPFVSSKKNFSR